MPQPHPRLIKLEYLQNETQVAVFFKAPIPNQVISVCIHFSQFSSETPQSLECKHLWHLLVRQTPVGPTLKCPWRERMLM